MNWFADAAKNGKHYERIFVVAHSHVNSQRFGAVDTKPVSAESFLDEVATATGGKKVTDKLILAGCNLLAYPSRTLTQELPSQYLANMEMISSELGGTIISASASFNEENLSGWLGGDSTPLSGDFFDIKNGSLLPSRDSGEQGVWTLSRDSAAQGLDSDMPDALAKYNLCALQRSPKERTCMQLKTQYQQIADNRDEAGRFVYRLAGHESDPAACAKLIGDTQQLSPTIQTEVFRQLLMLSVKHGTVQLPPAERAKLQLAAAQHLASIQGVPSHSQTVLRDFLINREGKTPETEDALKLYTDHAIEKLGDQQVPVQERNRLFQHLANTPASLSQENIDKMLSVIAKSNGQILGDSNLDSASAAANLIINKGNNNADNVLAFSRTINSDSPQGLEFRIKMLKSAYGSATFFDDTEGKRAEQVKQIAAEVKELLTDTHHNREDRIWLAKEITTKYSDVANPLHQAAEDALQTINGTKKSTHKAAPAFQPAAP